MGYGRTEVDVRVERLQPQRLGLLKDGGKLWEKTSIRRQGEFLAARGRRLQRGRTNRGARVRGLWATWWERDVERTRTDASNRRPWFTGPGPCAFAGRIFDRMKRIWWVELKGNIFLTKYRISSEIRTARTSGTQIQGRQGYTYLLRRGMT